MTGIHNIQIRLIAILSFSLIILTGCYYDNEEEVYLNAPCETGDISYSSDVVPLLSANCYNCHDIENAPVFGDGIILEGHSKLRAFIAPDSARFINSIKQNGKSSAMPKDARKLDNCSIAVFENWISQGMLNN